MIATSAIAGLASAVVLAAGVAGSSPAGLGVIFVPMDPNDTELADNLGEVAMAKLAETPGRQLVGAAELRRRSGASRAPLSPACLDQPACLANLGVVLGVRRLVAGAVRRQNDGFIFSVSLIDIATGRAEQRAFRSVAGSTADLVRAVQTSIDELVRPRPADARLHVTSVPDGARVVVDDAVLGYSPLLTGDLRPGLHRVRVEPEQRLAWRSEINLPAGTEVDLRLGDTDFPRRRRWPTFLAAGIGGAAAAALASAALFGMLAVEPLSGSTRAELQADLQRRERFGDTCTGLLITGGVLGIVSLATVVGFRREVFANQ